MKTSLFFCTFAAGFWLLNLIIRWNYIWDYNEWYCGRSCCVPISVSAVYWHSSKDTHTSAFDQIDICNPEYVKGKHPKISGKNILLLVPFLLCCICVEFSPTPKTLTYKRREWVSEWFCQWVSDNAQYRAMIRLGSDKKHLCCLQSFSGGGQAGWQFWVQHGIFNWLRV